jgi:hypothetical protein
VRLLRIKTVFVIRSPKNTSSQPDANTHADADADAVAVAAR